MEILHETVTANGSVFREEDHLRLAWLIYRRFGNDIGAGAEAWRRLLQNECTDFEFEELVDGHLNRVLDKHLEKTEGNKPDIIPRRFKRIRIEEC